jgi:DNA repair protein SbcC/Rad50
MQVKLNNFRSHSNSIYNIPNQNLILVKGVSGAGKSTIFQAIYWCLYGSLQHVFNNSNPSRCSVELKLNNISIYRQKKPELLKVLYEGKEYEDAVGQGIIDNIYGTKDVWMACSYLQQNSRNLLLSTSNSDKMKLIHQLSFNNENPDVFINKIENELTEAQKKLAIEQAVYGKEVEILTNSIKISNLDKSLYIDKNDPKRSELNNNIELISQKIVELKKIENYQNQLKGQIELIERNLSKINTYNEINIEDLKFKIENIDKDILNLNSLLTQANIYSQYKILKSKYEENLIKLEKYNDINNLDYAEQDLINASIIIEKYKKGKSIVDKYGINYDINEINTGIKNAEFLYELGKFRPIISKLNQLKLKLNEIKEVEFVDLTEINHKISLAGIACNVLKCPSCNSNLRYIDGKLQQSTIPNMSPRTIAQLKHEKDKIMKQNQLYENRKIILNNIQQLQSELENLYINNSIVNSRISNEFENINQYPEVSISVIYDLKQVAFIDSVPSIDTIKRCIDRNKLIYETNKLKEQIEQYGDNHIEMQDANTITLQINKLKTDISKKRNLLMEIIDNRKRWEDYKKQLNEILERRDDGYMIEIPDLEDKIQKIKIQIETIKRYDYLYEERDRLENKKETIILLHNEVVNLTKLKEMAMEVECTSLQNTIDSINNVINEIATMIFDEPITIKLNLFKTLKSKEKTKPSVNLSINYKGGEYDNINQLSGGEGDRVSLILTLALSKLSNFPIILLDESLGSLDSNLREMATKAIRMNTNKMVICVNHEGTEGYYDYQLIL